MSKPRMGPEQERQESMQRWHLGEDRSHCGWSEGVGRELVWDRL